MEKDSLVKRIGTTVGAAGLGLALAMGMPQDAYAGDGIPGAVRAESSTIDNGIDDGWDHCVNRVPSVQYNADWYDMCKRTMNINNGGSNDRIIDSQVPLESFAYHLILVRAGLSNRSENEYKRLREEGNLPLEYFSKGLKRMYDSNNNILARQHFATGVFTAAGYRESQALSKAEEFSEASLVDKERMLNEIDLNSLKKEEKRRLYWNLGFCLGREWVINKDPNIKILGDSNSDLLKKLENEFGYKTTDGNLT